MNILFLFRKRKSGNSEKGTIYCRITVDGTRCTPFSVYVKVEKKYWDANAQLILENSDEARADNQTLQTIREQIKTIRNEMLSAGNTITADVLKNEYISRTSPVPTVLQMCDQLISQKEAEGRAEGTIKSLRSRKKKIEKFFIQSKLSYLTCDNLKTRHCTELHDWLRRNGSGPTHAAKIMADFQETLDYAVSLEYAKANPVRLITYEKGTYKETHQLEWNELETLISHPFAAPSLREVRDLFVFACYTGMSYKDSTLFNPAKHIFDDEFGKEWIHYYREKPTSDCEAIIPLFPGAKRILERYRYHLPVICNQTYNRYLKEIAEIAHIRKHLTTKVARTTAGQLWLDAGVPLATVSRMLGHKSIQTTQKYYVKVRRSRIRLDFSTVAHEAFV